MGDYTYDEMAEAIAEGGSVHAELVAERNRLRAELAAAQGGAVAAAGAAEPEPDDSDGLSDVVPSVSLPDARLVPERDANGRALSTAERFGVLWRNRS